MGAVLSQFQADEEGNLIEKPIAYSSKGFSETERHYCARRRELLVIVYHVKRFDAYLRGQDFIIRTDYASFPSQFHRWVMTMEEYTYTVEVRKGVLHANGDAMAPAIKISLRKSCVIINKMSLIFPPKTFLIPISLVFCAMKKE